MAVIFVHSALPSDLSAAESGIFVDFIMKQIGGLFGNDPQMASFAVRKGAHFLEYTVLGLSLYVTAGDFLEIAKDRGNSASKNIPAPGNIIPWLAGTVYAVTDEFHQMFVPGRSCELRDMVIDSCGVASGILLCRILMKLKKSKN